MGRTVFNISVLFLLGASLCACSDTERPHHASVVTDSMGRMAEWAHGEGGDEHLKSLHQGAREHLERHDQPLTQGSKHHNSKGWHNQAQALISLLQGVSKSSTKQPTKEVQPLVKFILDVLEKTTLSKSTNCTADQLSLDASIDEVSRLSSILMTTIYNVQAKSEVVDNCDKAAKQCFEDCEKAGCCSSSATTTTAAPGEVECPNATQKYRIEKSGRHSRTCDFTKPNAAEHCWNALMNNGILNLQYKLEAMYDDYVDAKLACEKKEEEEEESQNDIQEEENKDQQCLGVKQNCLRMMNECATKQDDLQLSLCSSGLEGSIMDKCNAIKGVIDHNTTIAELDDARRKEWETLHIIKCMFGHYDQTGTFETGIYQTCADSIPDYTSACKLTYPQPGFQLSYGHDTCPSNEVIVQYQTWHRTHTPSDYVRTVKSVSSNADGKIFDEDSTEICVSQSPY